MFRKMIDNRRKKLIKRQQLLRQAMRAEIINAIQYEVLEEQKSEEISIPFFQEVQKRIDALQISSVKDLARTYLEFAKQGRVSGVINV